MAGLVNMLLQDLGILGATPTTFPELLTWIATAAISVTMLCGVIKLFFWTCAKIGKVGF